MLIENKSSGTKNLCISELVLAILDLLQYREYSWGLRHLVEIGRKSKTLNSRQNQDPERIIKKPLNL